MNAGPAATPTRTGRPAAGTRHVTGGDRGRRIAASATMRVEVEAARRSPCRDGRASPSTAVGSSSTGIKPEVTVAPHQPVVATQHADDGDAQRRECLAQLHLVAVRPDPVEHHAGRSAPVGSSVAKPCTTAATDAAIARGVDHQHDGASSSRATSAVDDERAVGGAVEQPHHPLDHQHVGIRAGPRRQGDDRVGTAQSRRRGCAAAGRMPARAW